MKIPIEHKDWLSKFYEPPSSNYASLIDFENDEVPQNASKVLQSSLTFKMDGKEAIIILPIVRDNNLAGWYATVKEQNLETELMGAIQAWIGPTYNSHFEIVTNQENDPRVKALKPVFKGPIVRFFGKDKTTISNKLINYFELLEDRPLARVTRKRAVGEIRSDIEKSISLGHLDQTESLKKELFAAGRFNAENKRYLEVQILSGFGQWRLLANNKPLISILSDLYVPKNVLSDVVEALYRTFIESTSTDTVLDEIIAIFKAQISDRYPRLFLDRRKITNTRVVKAFLLFELSRANRSSDAINKLVIDCDFNDQIQWENDVSKQDTFIKTEDENSEVDLAIEEFDYESAFGLLVDEPKNRSNIIKLVQCYLALKDAALFNQFHAYVSVIDEGDLDNLPAGAKKHISQALDEGQNSTKEVDGWLSWFDDLIETGDKEQSNKIIENEYKAWDVQCILSHKPQFHEFLLKCEKVFESFPDFLNQHYVKIIKSFFDNEGDGSDELVELGVFLLLLISQQERKSDFDLNIFNNLFVQTLELKPSPKSYLTLLSILDEVRPNTNSYNMLWWQLNVCEAMVLNPSPSTECREANLKYFLDTYTDIKSFSHRLQDDEFLLIQTLSKDFELKIDLNIADTQLEAENQTDIDLRDKVIAIYTLSETAGGRAKNTIETLYPGVSVKLNSDKECTEKLRYLSRSADYFLFVWKSSKHQAFYCIKDHLGRAPEYVSGKGTSSILSALKTLVAG